MNITQEVWLSENKLVIDETLRWLRDRPNGIVSLENGNHATMLIEKINPIIRLRLIKQGNFKPDLVQSKLNIHDPLHLVASYNQAMFLSLLWQNEPSQIYIIGLGGACIPTVLHHYLPEVHIHCTEIEPAMVTVAAKYFAMPTDERIRIFIEDGRAYLARQTPAPRYDIILIDAFLHSDLSPYPLVTQEFYQLCKQYLTETGVLSANILQRDSFYKEKVNTLQAVFDQVYICVLDSGNDVIFAHQGPRLEKKTLLERAIALQNKHQFAFPFVEHVHNLSPKRTLNKQMQILVDALKPINYI